MRAVAILTGSMLMVTAHVALAQAPNPTSTPPTTQTQTPPPPVAAPVAPPSQATAARPLPYRYGSISGSWLMPNGDFDKFASDGWAITLEGYQFIAPTRKIAVGTQVAYQSFGKKNGVTVSNFPVDAVRSLGLTDKRINNVFESMLQEQPQLSRHSTRCVGTGKAYGSIRVDDFAKVHRASSKTCSPMFSGAPNTFARVSP